MFQLIKNHYQIVILSIVIGLVSFLPQIIARNSLGEDFKGIYPTVNDDEIYYLARGQEIVDGHYFLTNPYLWEHKDESPMQFWLPDFLVAWPLKILNINISQGYRFYDFLMPVVLALLVYAIVFSFTERKNLALLGTVVINLGLFLSLFNRGPSPQFIFIFWLLLALFLVLFEKTKANKYFVLSAVTFGLLFYMYPYYWTYYVILFVIYFVLKVFFERNFVWKKYLFMFLGAGVISIPYFILYWQSTNLPFYQESVVRLGLLNTHFPSGFSIVFWGMVVLALFGLSFYKKKITINKFSLLLFSGTLAAMIAVNQHIITGKNLEFSSHYYHLSIVWYVFSAFYIISFWLENKKFIWLGRLAVLLVAGASIYSAIGVVYSQTKVSNSEKDLQKYGPVLEWLKINTEKNSVIWADQKLSALIPAYTSNNVFYAREANLFFISDQEVKERFIINNYWSDFTDEFIKDNERAIWGTQYINSYAHLQSKNKIRGLVGLSKIESERLPELEINNFKSKSESLKKDSIDNLLKNYRVDYIVVDKFNDDFRIEDIDLPRPLVEFDNISIYSI